ncbi:MAG: winged helix-turn-helix domain-containing protein [Archaeoglobaceae archaeon]|nr:winged helix-turn-helix domain-containing protein [Archaeoglobaceae archaeon]
MLELIISTRLQILLKLKERPHTITELSKALGFSKTTASYHLEKLQSGGLVERVQRGKWVYYKITDRGLRDVQIRLLTSLAFLATFTFSTIALIIKGVQKFREIHLPEIAREIKPANIVQPDYLLWQFGIMAIVSMLLFLYFRK